MNNINTPSTICRFVILSSLKLTLLQKAKIITGSVFCEINNWKQLHNDMLQLAYLIYNYNIEL